MPSPSSPPARAQCLLALLVAATLGSLSGTALAGPYRFPATPDGRPAEVRDECDVAPYLAAWKAAGLARARRMQSSATPNQSAWDARTYDLDLSFSPPTETVSGTVGVRATVLSGPLASLDLDLLANMTVDGTTAGGAPAGWTRSADVLTVLLDRAYSTGETIDVTVTYHGTPTGGAFGGAFGFDVAYGRTLIWSLSEPFGARSWWPCKDANDDKADSVAIRFTVPSGLITASNGTLLESTDNGTVAVTRWKERYPIATYLVSIASYPYATSTDWYHYAPSDSMPIRFFNFPEDAPGAAPVQSRVKDMIAALAARFGPYPFLAEKYGHAQFLFGGGMEHQTCTSLGAFNEFVVAHELTHQWWGDRVTCRDFHHVWLNEGFATYGEALWAESVSGPAAYHRDLSYNKYFGAGSVWVPDLSSTSRIFDSNLSYDKGSWVLHMLRHVLGDAKFFEALGKYGTQFAYSVATTEDFRDVCESVSGRDLDAFFQQWVYGEYYPKYRYATTTADAPGGGVDLTLTLEQIQSWQLFTMPVDVAVTTPLGTQSFVLQDSLASQSFTLHVDAAPTAVALDPDDWILKTVDAPIVQPPFDRGVLLVNGVDWASYGSELTSAYVDRAFWGDYSIDFWDHFDPPAGGYPVSLPAPLGHGLVPPEVLGHYRNLVWIGNNFSGDVASWMNTPILSYLKHGGNVLLMTRSGEQFLDDSLSAYLGVATLIPAQTLYDCVPTRPGLASVTRLGAQNPCVVFDTVFTHDDSELLFKVDLNYTPDRGIGVLRRPAGGAGLRARGGRFIFLSGRPYRWNHVQLRTNVMAMLANYFFEPSNPLDTSQGGAGPTALLPARPNPFGSSTILRFALERGGDVRLEVLDLAGRRVRTLQSGPLPPGTYERAWDGLDDGGRAARTGVYWARLEAPGRRASVKMVLAR